MNYARTLSSIIVLASLLSSCGGGGGDSPAPGPDLTPRPDLTVTVLETNPVSPTTAGFDIIVKFINAGSVISNASTVLLEQQNAGGWSVLGSLATPALGPGVGGIVTFTPIGVTAGSLTIRATILPVANETALGNNEETMVALVAPAAGG